MSLDLPVIAGALSSVLFALGTLPMLVKAVRTKDLSSYSLGNIALSNIANVIYSVYVLHLPPGPVWALHGFHLLSTGLMLIWYVRYSSARRRSPRPPQRPAPTQKRTTASDCDLHDSPDAARLSASHAGDFSKGAPVPAQQRDVETEEIRRWRDSWTCTTGLLGVTAAQLQEAHERDQAMEGEEGFRFERSWLDPEAGKVFCLSSAPSRESVMRIHERAGHPTSEVYELSLEMV